MSTIKGEKKMRSVRIGKEEIKPTDSTDLILLELGRVQQSCQVQKQLTKINTISLQ